MTCVNVAKVVAILLVTGLAGCQDLKPLQTDVADLKSQVASLKSEVQAAKNSADQATSTAQSSSGGSVDKDRAIYSGYAEAEVVIDRPVAQVWRQFLDLGSWITSQTIENVTGPPNTVGAITRVTSLGAIRESRPAPHYHYCQIIKLIPERQYVRASYTEKGGSYGLEGSASKDVRFVEMGGKTKVIYSMFAEFRGESATKKPAAMDTMMDGERAGILRSLNTLKRIVENP
jgi:outer membrane murein-binding lipoprotein Lpp